MLNFIAWLIIGSVIFLSVRSLIKEIREIIAKRKEKKGDVNGGSSTDTV